MLSDDGGPWFSRHALIQARRRFPDLAMLHEDQLVEELSAAVLDCSVVEETPGGFVAQTHQGLGWFPDPKVKSAVLRGRLTGLPVEFVVDPDSGCVITVIDPDETLKLVAGRRAEERRIRNAKKRRKRG